jgi:hypothetical protein
MVSRVQGGWRHRGGFFLRTDAAARYKISVAKKKIEIIMKLSLFSFADGATLDQASFEMRQSVEPPANFPCVQSISAFPSQSGHLGRAYTVPLSVQATHIRR